MTDMDYGSSWSPEDPACPACDDTQWLKLEEGLEVRCPGCNKPSGDGGDNDRAVYDHILPGLVSSIGRERVVAASKRYMELTAPLRRESNHD